MDKTRNDQQNPDCEGAVVVRDPMGAVSARDGMATVAVDIGAPPYGRDDARHVSNTLCHMVARRCLVVAVSVWVAPVMGQIETLPNGIASGDVDQTSVVLWARSTIIGPVLFDYAIDPEFGTLDGSASAMVVDVDVPVKVELTGLQSDTLYHYRVTDAAGGALTGKFRTLAASGLNGLRFGVSGDSRGDLRPFVSIANVPERDPDFFIELGDTIYADWPFQDLPASQSRTLPELRARHAEVFSERFGINALADLRAATPVYAVIDDHEVTNDFAGGAPPSIDLRFDQTGAFINETDLYGNGVQAFHEYNPIRKETYGETRDPRTANKPKLYRFRTFGSDAALILLDARSFRDASLGLDLRLVSRAAYIDFLESSFDPTRTMLGNAQLGLLEHDLLSAEARGITWKFIVVPEPIQLLGPALACDRFEGYAFERTRILRFISENEIENVVFLSADIHTSLVNNLTYQDSATSRQIETTAFEVVMGPIAFASPLGPTVMSFAPPALRAIHDRLGRAGQNNLYRTLAAVALDFYRLPRFGLQNTPIDAALLAGRYFSGNTYGWSEFEIDAATQCLTVTTWGIPWYGGGDVASRPDYVLSLTPKVISRFRVRPTLREGMVAFDADVAACRSRRALCGVLGVPTLAAGVTLWLALFLCRVSAGRTRSAQRGIGGIRNE